MDPEVVAELARTPGDAEGYGYTGTIDGVLEEVDCPCLSDAAIEALSLCTVTGLTTSGRISGQIDAVQTDGYIVVGLDRFVITGGLWDNGTISAGSVSNLTSVVSKGYVITRADGELVENADGRPELELDIQHRITGELFLSLDPDVPESIDCTERLHATGVLRP